MGTWKSDARAVTKRTRRGRYKARFKGFRRRSKDITQMASRRMPLLQRNINGFPDNLVTTLRYVDVYTLTVQSGSFGKQVWSFNSINDPDVTGVGHQPMFHDQYQAVYNRYTVLGSKIKVTFVPQNSTGGPYVVGVMCTPDTTSSTTVSTIMESNKSTHQIIGPATGGPNCRTFTGTFSPARDLGLDDGDDTVGSTFGSNPSIQYYLLGYFYDTTTSATVNQCVVKVDIEYCVRLRQVKDISAS